MPPANDWKLSAKLQLMQPATFCISIAFPWLRICAETMEGLQHPLTKSAGLYKKCANVNSFLLGWTGVRDVATTC